MTYQEILATAAFEESKTFTEKQLLDFGWGVAVEKFGKKTTKYLYWVDEEFLCDFVTEYFWKVKHQ